MGDEHRTVGHRSDPQLGGANGVYYEENRRMLKSLTFQERVSRPDHSSRLMYKFKSPYHTRCVVEEAHELIGAAPRHQYISGRDLLGRSGRFPLCYGHHPQLWIPMSSREPVDECEVPWIPTGFPWETMVSIQFPWIPMGSEFSWEPIGTHGNSREAAGIHGNTWEATRISHMGDLRPMGNPMGMGSLMGLAMGS